MNIVNGRKRDRAKYYILAKGNVVRVASRRIWELWFSTTSHDERLLARTVIGNHAIGTFFYGMEQDGLGVYRTYINHSKRDTVLRHHASMTPKDALQEHLALMEEIRIKHENQK